MRRPILWCAVVLLAAAPVRAQEAPAARTVLDLWDAAYLDGAHAGYRHTTVQKIEREGGAIFRTTQYVHLTIKRYNSVVTQRMANTTDETPDGKVVGVSLTQYLDKGQFTQSGTVEDGQLIVRTPRDPDGKALPWEEGVIGLYGQEVVFEQRKVKPGDRFRYLDYQLALLSAIPVQVEVKDREPVETLAVKKVGDKSHVEWVKKPLLRVVASPGKVRVGKDVVPLPKLVVWLDDGLHVMRSQSDVPGLGRLILYRTTREVAERQGVAPALLNDLGLRALVRLAKPIEGLDQAREVVYRITASEDDDPATLFSRDARQTVENVKDNTFDLRIRPIRAPHEVDDAPPVGAEYLKSSYFLDSDNERIRDLAERLTGREENPWRKAQRLEKWVHENMKQSTEVGFAPASQILADPRGDCRQHAMLTAALCRAANVPSRTAVGLVYVADREHGPVLGFHMWTEVWIKGQWLMLDAMLGEGSVGAGHLKISDSSWQDIQTLAPLLPVTRVTGKIKVEVLSVK
jgi:hypothetical protein